MVAQIRRIAEHWSNRQVSGLQTPLRGVDLARAALGATRGATLGFEAFHIQQEEIMATTVGPRGLPIEIGIDTKKRQAVAEGLSKLLADSYTLYLKTHNFHWNVTGPMFSTLHLMFEQQYNELALAVDLVAERIRALGFPAPGSYEQFARLSSVKEAKGVPQAEDMIRELVEGQEAVARTARQVFPIAEDAADQVTMDLLTQRLQVHEKTAWMLRSLLE
jgi:starvation-inducible DNA-binding protein